MASSQKPFGFSPSFSYPIISSKNFVLKIELHDNGFKLQTVGLKSIDLKIKKILKGKLHAPQIEYPTGRSNNLIFEKYKNK